MNKQNDFSLDIWLFQDQLTRRLSWWSIGSILVGALMLLPEGFWRGLGMQFIVWGIIDLAIAFFGARSASNRKAKLSPAELLSTAPRERANLAKILWINTGLDVFYVAGGAWLAFTWGANDPSWLGGWGIMIQGGFLFVFDLFHALKLR